ncbi:hypothetical protein [Paenibacillus sp. N3.4]|uniref:hypothetical protein n=1 Tax=Paenibacillus sp. N3.4 TaxID=2603222 RepID=UPI0011CB1876|nr:hypothetical protein [Paenibacillus sp. N3.4]TXK74858.1 hypothetical protein FU659_28235 [Paenibacillus sp. N3.4]
MNTQDMQRSLDYEIHALTGEVTIEGQKASLRDLAFLGYALVQKGEAEQTVALLRVINESERLEQAALTEKALVMWTLGEYLKSTDDSSFGAEMLTFIRATVQEIETNWQKPQPHWLQGEGQGIYLSHLAIYFAAIQSNVQHGVGETGVRLLKSIRELLFAKFIKDGRVVSQLGDTSIHGDIIAAAIPFGMLGIEDRILIEALYQLEETLVGKGVRLCGSDTYYGGCERPDLTCLLVWYYAKKGDTVRAKELLARVESLREEHGVLFEVDTATAKEPLMLEYWLEREADLNRKGFQGQAYEISLGHVSPLSSVLAELAQGALASGAVGNGSSSGVTLIHKPTGYDDPYVILPYERFPREPEAGDAVIVHLLTQPFQASQVVTVQATVNGVPAAQAVPAIVKVLADGEKVWEAQLGPYLAGDEVSYAFALQSGGKSAASPTYRFRVRSWTALERVHAMYETTDGFVVELAGTGAAQPPVLSFRADASGAVQLTFAASGERTDGQRAQHAALAVGRARLEATCGRASSRWRCAARRACSSKASPPKGSRCLRR